MLLFAAVKPIDECVPHKTVAAICLQSKAVLTVASLKVRKAAVKTLLLS